jgi:hypothetical protein
MSSSRRRRGDVPNHMRTGAAAHPGSLDTSLADTQKRNYNVNVSGGPGVSVRRTSSEERIIPDRHPDQYGPSSPIGLQSLKSGQINVKKTVDVQVYPTDDR